MCFLSFFFILFIKAECNFQPDLDIINAESYVDLWGHRIDWHNLEDGWTHTKRFEYLRDVERMLWQMENIPKYTLHGYKKMKIPSLLHESILKERNSSIIEPEECGIPNPRNNCYRIKTRFAFPLKYGRRQHAGDYI